MARRIGLPPTHWGEYEREADLPNVRTSVTQTSELRRGDLARIGDVPYQCDDPTQDGASWRRQLVEFVDPRWDDLRFPATGINPVGLAAPPDRDSDSGLFLFSGVGTEVISIIGQMPHAWQEGTEIRPHVHWIQRAAGVVVWQLDYVIANNREPAPAAFPGSYASATASAAEFPYTSGDLMQITSFPPIEMTGKRDSCLLFLRVSRLGADAADTYVGDVELVEFDVHYQRDGLGSVEEFPGAGS